MKFFIIFSLCFSCALLAFARDTYLTIYNDNLAVVREIREVQINENRELVFSDVAGLIDPTSVKLSIPGVEVLEQNYEYDLINNEKLLQNRLGQNVEFILEKGDIVSGKLLTASSWGTVIETSNGLRIIQSGIQQVLLSGTTEGMFLKPTLIWLLDKQPKGKVSAELTYITNGVNWKAEYVLVLRNKTPKLDLQGWVDIQNNSGADYPNSTIKLIAGTIHRIQQPPYVGYLDRAQIMMEKTAGSQFEERQMYEYHLYELQRKTTLSDKQNKQISLLTVNQIPYTQEYHYLAVLENKRVQTKILFKNNKESGLNIPLPAGRMRIFQEEASGNREFVGEDAISHTPTNAEIALTVGDAFDIVGETVQLNYKNITNRITETDYRVELRNSKKQDVLIKVIIKGYGEWSIVRSSDDVENISAQEKQIKVNVGANAKKIITYTIRQN